MRQMRATILAFSAGLGLAWLSFAFGQTGPYNPAKDSVTNQAYNIASVTPSNTTIISPTRALYTGGTSGGAACTMIVTPNGGTPDGAHFFTFANVQPGEILPIQAIQVGASSTCTAILALY